MRLPDAAHTGRPWRIHELTRDFRLEDVWAFRTPGAGPDDFPVMLAAMRAAGGPARQPLPARCLFAARWKLGALFGWDGPEASVGARVPTLRDRLPDDLRELPRGPESASVPLTPVYELHDESARELANKTVHTIMHLGWVPTGRGEHELRMAVLVKPNGLFGTLYMAAIAPFRYLVVYPALTRQWERAWRDRESLVREGGGPAYGDLADGGPGDGVRADDSATVDGYVGEREVPASVLGLSPLPGYDYVDQFTRATSVEATPEEWARALFGDVPSAAERFIWRGLLGLRLSRGRSPRTVAGWRIAERGRDWIRLETASWFLTGNLLVRAGEGRVSLMTSLRYDRFLGRLVWPPLSAVHRRLAPGLLHDAVAKLRSSRGERTRP